MEAEAPLLTPQHQGSGPQRWENSIPWQTWTRVWEGMMEEAGGGAEEAGKEQLGWLPNPFSSLRQLGRNPNICVWTMPEAPRDTWAPLVIWSMCRRL